LNTAKEWRASKIEVNTSNERATLTFTEEIPAIRTAVLRIEFAGTMNTSMAGFYRSKYKPAITPSADIAKQGEDCYMFSTQFEACDARRAFPCFDEPNLKASFEFEIEIPEHQVALSNMPEKSTREGSRPGLKVVSFDKTPAMSTYV
jgi:aminopeptidase N